MTCPPDQSGTWIPLILYASKNGVSLSTLRRHIKAGKIQYRVEEGRYLVWDSSESPTDCTDLERDLKRAREEIAELKTLIALYEENIPERDPNG